MIKFAVIGHPVQHSRSPGMHNAAFAALGIDAEYLRIDVDPQEIGGFTEYARRHLAGFNLTVPHKQSIIPHLDFIAPEAKIIGSVNTVKIDAAGKLSGCSTDGEGFEAAVRVALGLPLAGKKFLLLGCGGAARAVAFQLAWRNARQVVIANRHPEKAAALATEIGGGAAALDISDPTALRRELEDTDLLIQATSLGLRPEDASPLDPALLERLPNLAVMDLIYRPTPLLLRARALRLRCCDGREMLLRQGAASFRFWTGCPPPLEKMRAGMESDSFAAEDFNWKRD